MASCYGVRLGRCVVWRLEKGGFGMADLFRSEVCIDEVNMVWGALSLKLDMVRSLLSKQTRFYSRVGYMKKRDFTMRRH